MGLFISRASRGVSTSFEPNPAKKWEKSEKFSPTVT
jgi:hypothetical protein